MTKVTDSTIQHEARKKVLGCSVHKSLASRLTLTQLQRTRKQENLRSLRLFFFLLFEVYAHCLSFTRRITFYTIQAHYVCVEEVTRTPNLLNISQLRYLLRHSNMFALCNHNHLQSIEHLSCTNVVKTNIRHSLPKVWLRMGVSK